MSLLDHPTDDLDVAPADNTEPTPIDHRDADWDRDATRHLKAIDRLQQREHQVQQAFDREIGRLIEQRDMALSAIRNRIAWERAPLIQLHRAILAEDPTRKTIVLPYGKLTSSTPQTPKVRYMDRDAFIEWARTNAPGLVQAKWSEDRKAVTAALGDVLVPVGAPRVGWSADIASADGEIVPGITYAIDDTTFGIQIADEL